MLLPTKCPDMAVLTRRLYRRLSLKHWLIVPAGCLMESAITIQTGKYGRNKLFPTNRTKLPNVPIGRKWLMNVNTFFSNYGSRYHLMYTNKRCFCFRSGLAEDSIRQNLIAVLSEPVFSEMGNNKKMIFYRLDNAAGTMQYDRMPNRSGNTNDYRGGSLLGATQEMVDAYFMSNGESLFQAIAADGVLRLSTKIRLCRRGVSTTEYKGMMVLFMHRQEPEWCMLIVNLVLCDITFSNSKWFPMEQKAII